MFGTKCAARTKKRRFATRVPQERREKKKIAVKKKEEEKLYSPSGERAE